MSSLPRNATKLVPLPLHAGLSTAEQLAVFERPEKGERKVIVATNIAEVCRAFIPLRFVLMMSGQRDH